MFRDPLAIEKCRLESILWARRIAGGGPGTSTPSSSGAAAVRGLGRITADFSEPMPRPDLALAREGVRRRGRSTATTREP